MEDRRGFRPFSVPHRGRVHLERGEIRLLPDLFALLPGENENSAAGQNRGCVPFAYGGLPANLEVLRPRCWSVPGSHCAIALRPPPLRPFFTAGDRESYE